MPKTESPASSKSSGNSRLPAKFPAGLRVLVVDDDPTCLKIIEKMLKKCNYEVTVCNKAKTALSFLRKNKKGCDVVLSDVHMPDMDGFKLLEHIGLEMDLPVIMMSADDSNNVVMKGVIHGACDYITKPVRMERLRTIWQHVVRKQKHKWKDSGDDVDQQQKVEEDVDYTSSGNEAQKLKKSKRKKDDDDDSEEADESSSKKPRVVWTLELHREFVKAVNLLGLNKAVPKKILDLMNIPGLTRENIASHLQKYRMYLKRLSESQHQDSVDTSFMGTMDPCYDLQDLNYRGQVPSQSPATVLGRSNNSRYIPNLMPAIDQRNTFTSFTSEDLNFRHQEVNGVYSQALMGRGQSQNVFSNGMRAHGLGSNGSLIVPVYNNLNQIRPGVAPNYNILNQIRPESGSNNVTFSGLLTHSSPERMRPITSFSADDESETHSNGTRQNVNQYDLLSAIFNKPQKKESSRQDDLHRPN